MVGAGAIDKPTLLTLRLTLVRMSPPLPQALEPEACQGAGP